MEKKPTEHFVRNLKLDTRLSGALFAVASIRDGGVSKNGKRYFSIRMGDKTGYRSGTIWLHEGSAQQEAAEVSKLELIKLGDVVRVRCLYEKFNNGWFKIDFAMGHQIDIVPAGGYDPADFLAVSPYDTKTQLKLLNDAIAKMQSEPLRTLCKSFLEDGKFIEQLAKAPGAQTQHHAYQGGLLDHILEVMQLCETCCTFHKDLDRDLLITGAFLHDIGKMRVYEYKESAIVIKDVDSLIGHLTLSHTMVGEKIRVLREKGVDFQEDLEMLLAHLILSHHGEEGGSAVRPKTPEAVALHHADNFDSQVAKEIGRMPDAGQ